jgi:trimeric autotransporter adhesin
VKAKSFSRALFCAVLALMGTATLSAQTYQGGIRGVVQDPGGAVIPNAKVTLMNQATNVSRSSLSNADGTYVFSQVDPATYSLKVEAPGFKTATHPGVIVGTQQTVTLDFKMDVGEVSDSVQVTADVPLVDNSNASNGQVLDSQKMTDLPNLGRNPFLLSKLANNVVPAGDPRFNRFQDQSGSSQISIVGGPVRGNNYLIDGIPITDSTNRAVIIPSIEATQEMNLQAGVYDATMGRTGGGVFNTLLKSGTNQFHGSLLGYTRQTDWLANNFFYNSSGKPRPDTPFYNWGASFGGPVVIPKVYNGKDKTFFWVATESYRQRSGLTGDYALPTALERNGDYSQSSVNIYDPMTSRACTAADNCPAGVSVVRSAFPGNMIPLSRINPVGAAIMSYLPLPTRMGPTDSFNFTGTDTLQDRADEYTAKVDQSFTNWFRVTASYMHYKSREPGGNTLGTLPGGAASYLLYRKVDATAINAILTPTPTTVVTARYGFNRFPNFATGTNYGFSPSTLGFPSSYVSSIQAQYFPRIGMLNNTFSGISPSSSVFWSKNALVSVSKYIGRHSITFGFDYRLIHTDFTSLTYAAGNYSFNGIFTRQYPTKTNGTGADFADLALGAPSSGSLNTTTKLFDFVRYYSGYIQDDFRVNNKLTLNLGLRYEYETGIMEQNNALVVGFDPTAMNPIASTVTGITPLGALQYAGVNGNPTSCCDVPGTKFGPRLGVAYQLNDKTTLRAGWGMFYAPTIFSTDGSIAPGYNQTTTYVASNDGNATPANSLSNPFPNGILQPVGNSLGALTAIGSSFNYLDQKRTAGLVHQFSADVQRQLPDGIVLEVGYVGSRSYNLQPAPTGNGNLNMNQVPTQYLSMGSKLSGSVPNPFYGSPYAAGVIGSKTVSQAQLLLPFPEYSNIGVVTNPASAQYDALDVKLQKRLANGLTFLSTFTWSKNMDNEWASGSANAFNGFTGSTPPSEPQNYYDLGAEWALAATNTPLRLTETWTYQLPFGEGQKWLSKSKLADLAVGGWQINGIATFQSGFPLFIFQQNLNSVIGTGAQRPNATGIDPSMSGSVESRLGGYLNPAAFSLAPAYTFGNVSRSIGTRGPGMANWDVSLFKNFKISERFNAEFRAEALNLFNTPLFANPNTNFGTAAFGKITYQANLPRQLQLGVRFFF